MLREFGAFCLLGLFGLWLAVAFAEALDLEAEQAQRITAERPSFDGGRVTFVGWGE